METISQEVRDIGRFIRARREVTPIEQFPQLPQRRRHVPHLTQGDLAELASVSSVVISQIEQGRYPNLTHGLLNRIANALHFTPQQEVYVLGLLEPRADVQKTLEPAPEWVTKSIELTAHPAGVVNPAYDVLAVNPALLGLFGSVRPGFTTKRNSAYSIFTLPGVREMIDDWPAYASSVVSGLRISYAHFPNWRNHIDELVARLRQTDPWFGECWDRDDPLVKPTMEKTFHHPELGEILVLQILTDIVEAPGLTKIEFMPANDESAAKLAKLG